MPSRSIPPEYQHDWRDRYALWTCRDCDFETEDWDDALAHDPDHAVRGVEKRYIPGWAEESDTIEIWPGVDARRREDYRWDVCCSNRSTISPVVATGMTSCFS